MKVFKGLYLLNFFKKMIFRFLMFFGTLNYGESPCYLFLLFKTYSFIFYYKIDSLEKYSLATDITTSLLVLSPNITQDNLVFIFFLLSRTP